jgi:hypothetical protein
MSARTDPTRGSSLWQITTSASTVRELTHPVFEDADPDW